MSWLSRTLRASILSGLLAAPLFDIVSASLYQPALQQRTPEGAASPGIAITSSPTLPAAASLTAVSECHFHESSVYCKAGATEYVVQTTATRTADIPPAFTGCHTHGADILCIAPSGDDVQISLAPEDPEGADIADQLSSGGQTCHFHAGVEHCITAKSEIDGSVGCAKVERDYNIPLRVGLLFVILVTSSIGVFTPILITTFVSPQNIAFTLLRQFGTGVIIATAFVHLFTHANLMFGSECLGELTYESTAAAILMAGLFLSFLVEYAGIRLVQWHSAKSSSENDESPAAGEKSLAAKTEMVNISVLEAGVIFHSLLIGLTLVVSGDTFFLTLFAVIVFHQMFEGIALGSRIAALGQPVSATSAHSHGHGIGHHSHFHEPKQHNPTTLTEELVAASDSVPHPGPNKRQRKTSAGDTASGEESDILTAAPLCDLGHHVPMRKKLALAAAFAMVTPVGMAIGIGVLKNFNGNDPSTIIAVGTLDALSAGILVWVGVVEMWAHDWMLGGEMTTAGPLRTTLGMTALIAGMALMSLLGKWA